MNTTNERDYLTDLVKESGKPREEITSHIRSLVCSYEYAYEFYITFGRLPGYLDCKTMTLEMIFVYRRFFNKLGGSINPGEPVKVSVRHEYEHSPIRPNSNDSSQLITRQSDGMYYITIAMAIAGFVALLLFISIHHFK